MPLYAVMCMSCLTRYVSLALSGPVRSLTVANASPTVLCSSANVLSSNRAPLTSWLSSDTIEAMSAVRESPASTRQHSKTCALAMRT